MHKPPRASCLFDQVAECFIDHRDPERVEHTVIELAAQRVLGLCMGYEDHNDHDTLRYDPLFAAAVGRVNPLGKNRSHHSYEGAALAGHATLNRLEHAPLELVDNRPDLKILLKEGAFEELFVRQFLNSYDTPPSASSWMSMPLMIGSMANKKALSTTVITEATNTRLYYQVGGR